MRWVLALVMVSAACGSSGGNSAFDAAGGGDDDGAIVDAAPGAVDAAVIADAAMPTEPVACGDTICRIDQSCVDGTCRFECPDGAANVPGDYDSIQAAFTALEHVGGVICIDPWIEYAGPYSLFSVYPTADLTVIGSGTEATAIVGELVINDAWDQTRTTPIRFEMRGLAVEGGLELITHQPFHDEYLLEDLRITGHVSGGDDLSFYVGHNYGSNIVLDGLDVYSPGGIAVGLYPTSGSPPPAGTVTLRNSWVHDSESAVIVVDDYYGQAVLANNTFARGYAGIWGRGTNALTYVNNVFVDFNVAQGAFLYYAGVHHHNAYLASGATEPPLGESDVLLQSPDLSTETVPPSPSADSQLRGAADPSFAPALDYWANPRGTAPDIGAVQRW
jgi:hypothetical protein